MTTATSSRHIIALGGCGLAPEPQNLLLYRYILGHARSERPSVLYVPTASGEAQPNIVQFYATFTQLSCQPAHLSLFTLPSADLRGFVLGQDVVYVGGGNTKSMLALWREWGLDSILREAWEGGTVLAGVSAGAICWFQEGITDSVPGPLTPLNCLGYVKGSCCPHYDSELARRPTYSRMVAEGRLSAGYAADDLAGLHFVGDELASVVSGRAQ
ncbi:MAG TPA: peptidase E, partial [Ktedonobacterales bacterium]|nr:peptidase E [Ktedonobacterales bacterium]